MFSVFDDEVRRKLFKQGANLTLDQALTILLTAESTAQLAFNLKQVMSPESRGFAKFQYKKKKEKNLLATRKITSRKQKSLLKRRKDAGTVVAKSATRNRHAQLTEKYAANVVEQALFMRRA